MQRVELINRVQSVDRVSNVKKAQPEKKNEGSESFEQVLAFEKNKRNQRDLSNIPVSVNMDVMNGTMNYYNNRAMEAYFIMNSSTTDLRG